VIIDPAILQEVRDEWKFAIKTQNSIRTTLGFYESIPPQARFDHFSNLTHALVLTFAFSVLEKTLRELRDQGVFNCTRNELKELMNKSRPAISWLNFTNVYEGREKRNDLVHRQGILNRKDTWKYIDAIEKELIGWKVLTGPEERWGYRGV
jgi:hypothetical protein